MTKEFKKKSLDCTRMLPCLSDFGVENYSYQAKNPSSGQYHLKGTYQGKDFLLNVFENNDGSTTIGFSSGQDRNLFEVLAEEIVRVCSYSDTPKLELSIPKFPVAYFNGLIDFLKDEGASIQDEKGLPYDATQYRLKGCKGDTLIIKVFKNETVQFQGKNAHLASLVWDYLCNVLSLEEVLEKQSQAYKISVTAEDINDELGAKMPVSHQFLEEVVRKQLSSALMLCKINLPLEDYSAVAFPALRGLEGFIKQVLLKSGLKPTDKSPIGEYFEQKVVGQYILQKSYADCINEPYSNILANSYTYYFNQRHGIFHMNANVETSRILGSHEDARRIVFGVFDMIEAASQKLCI